jgi:glycosyltransferase involved in cell wall biosynthesis
MLNLIFIAGKNLLNPTKGAEIRMLELVKGLVGQNRIHVLNFDDGKRAADSVKQLANPRITIFNHPLRHAMQKMFPVRMITAGSRHLSKAPQDAILASHLWAGPCALALSRRFQVPLVFDDHNVEYMLMQQQGHHLAAAGVKLLESQIIRRAEITFSVSKPDKEKLKKWAREIEVLPNGTALSPPILAARASQPVVLFFGNLGYAPNQEAVTHIVKHIAPAVAARMPGVEFRIVGAPPPMIEAPQVTVTGYVDCLEKELDRAALVIVPLSHGSGTRIKILDALARHRPVLATPIGAEGIPPFDSLKIAPLDRFPSAIIEMLQYWDNGNALFSDNDRIAIRSHTWEHVARQLSEILVHRIKRQPSRLIK